MEGVWRTEASTCRGGHLTRVFSDPYPPFSFPVSSSVHHHRLPFDASHATTTSSSRSKSYTLLAASSLPPPCLSMGTLKHLSFSHWPLTAAAGSSKERKRRNSSPCPPASLAMDAYEATRVVFSRIQGLDPEHAAKIMGVLLVQGHGEEEMIRLAFGPDALLHSVVLKARWDIGLLLMSPSSPPSSPSPQNSASCHLTSTDELINPSSSCSGRMPCSSTSYPPPFFGGDLVEEFQLRDQLPYFDDATAASSPISIPSLQIDPMGNSDF